MRVSKDDWRFLELTVGWGDFEAMAWERDRREGRYFYRKDKKNCRVREYMEDRAAICDNRNDRLLPSRWKSPQVNSYVIYQTYVTRAHRGLICRLGSQRGSHSLPSA